MPSAPVEQQTAMALTRDLSQVSSIYRQDRTNSRSAYRDAKAEAVARTEEMREEQTYGAVSKLTQSVGTPIRRMEHQTASSHGARGSRGAARIAHFDLDHRHKHGPTCGHHYYDKRWHDFPRSHRHGPGCGHHFRNGVWLSFSITHRHGTGCGHFLDGGHWLSHSTYHRHGTGCGHYFYGGLWRNYPQRHVHFDGCGHYWHGSVWLDFPPAHRHSASCGHLYDGVGWYVHGAGIHSHGAGCGHFYYEGRWNLYPRRYYTRYRRNAFYFFIDLGDYHRRNVPTRVYDEYIYDEREPEDIYMDSDPVSQAYAAFARGRFYESVIAFNNAIEFEPENGILYFARAQAHVAIRDYRSAYDDMIRGMDLVPEWSEVDFSIAELYSDPQWFEEHFQALSQWVADYPRDYKAHFVLGYIHFFEKDYASAKSEFVYTLAWDEEHEQAKRMLDSVLGLEAEMEVEALVIEEQNPEIPPETHEPGAKKSPLLEEEATSIN